MGNPKAFLEIHRQEAHDFGEVEQTLNTRERKLQASRCMDCGVPFCHWACPLGNKAPEWNDALYKGDWELAYHLLNSTNPFPEFTGRICPALCEKACVLNRFNHEPTTNREDECAIIEAAFREGYIVPHTNIKRNGKKVAVVGAGPAGLAAANDLNLMGYEVTVFEKNEAAGGLLRYGIPNFKLNKAIIDRRIALLEAEGIEFRYGSAIALEDLGNPGDPAPLLLAISRLPAVNSRAYTSPSNSSPSRTVCSLALSLVRTSASPLKARMSSSSVVATRVVTA